MRHGVGNSIRLLLAYLAGFYSVAVCALLLLERPFDHSWVATARGYAAISGLLIACPILAVIPAIILSSPVLKATRPRLGWVTFLRIWVSSALTTALLFAALVLLVAGWSRAEAWVRFVGSGFLAAYLLACPACGCLAAGLWLSMLRSLEHRTVELTALEAELTEAGELLGQVTAIKGPWSQAEHDPNRYSDPHSAELLGRCRDILDNLALVLEEESDVEALRRFRVRFHWQVASLCCALGQYEDAAAQLSEMGRWIPLVPPHLWASQKDKEDCARQHLLLTDQVARVAHPDRPVESAGSGQ